MDHLLSLKYLVKHNVSLASPMTSVKRRFKFLMLATLFLTFLFSLTVVGMWFFSFPNPALDKAYAAIDKGATSENFRLQKVKVPGTTFHHPSSVQRPAPEAGVRYGQPRDASGHLYYDTLRHNVVLHTEEYARDTITGKLTLDVMTHYVRIGNNGQVVEAVKGMDLRGKDFLQNCIVLQNELLPYQKWTDPTQKIYLRHFAKEKFNGGCLNPFKIGPFNGGTPCPTWEGTGYYDITFQQEQLKVKIPCTRSSMFYGSDSEYYTGLYYYTLPPSPTSAQPVAFLVYSKTHEQPSIYIITSKQPL